MWRILLSDMTVEYCDCKIEPRFKHTVNLNPKQKEIYMQVIVRIYMEERKQKSSFLKLTS